MQYVITKANGEQIAFTTTLTTDQAGEIVAALPNVSEFSGSLVSAWRRGRLSPKQELWLLKLAHDASQGPAVAGPYAGLVARITRMQERAKGRVQFRLPEVTVKAVTRGVNAGACYLYSPGGEYWGKISPAGELHSSLAPELRPHLDEAAADPVAAAVRYGRLTGNCACCGRTLTDPKSIELGIGPICLTRLQ
jgi:hypothetical protein